MKKFSFFTVLVMIAFAGFFFGCEEDKVETAPTLEFFGGVYIDDDVTVEPEEMIKFSWVATKGSSNLKSFSIERDGVNLAGFPDEDIPKDTYKDSISLVAPSNEGSYIYLFTVTDNNDLADSASFVITVELTGGPINTYAVTLGSHQSASGSSFASTNGLTYQMDEAKANDTLIDFLYYYGATNEATLAAPDNSDAATVFSDATNGLATWATRNSTKFKSTSLTATDFDAITDDLLIVSNATGAADSDQKHLEQGDVIAFVTDADKEGGSKMGFVKVTSITTGAAGSMQISVKVQQ